MLGYDTTIRLKARRAYNTQPTIRIQEAFAIPVLPSGWVATGTKMAANVKFQIQFLSRYLQRRHSTACNYQSLENRCQC